ncbi:hypothetical protein HPAKL117_04790 [Helicobacter pylori Aklavik117]|uniref:hypothetical protein n=1 Tax=Helicobacter pylori TaxID=210 RepID=UPI00029D22F8|nr:hypothetical protein HPAKL117_04790 [Helicobacter pylori Aklavik117]
MVCLKAKIQKNQTPPIKPKHAKTTTKKSNLKPQSLSRKKGLLKTWRIRDALIGKFYEQRRLQTTSHRFRACETKNLNTINQNQNNPPTKKLKTKEIKNPPAE